MKYRTDLILGEAFCLFIFFYFLDSGLSVLNGLQFYFWLRDSENLQLIQMWWNAQTLEKYRLPHLPNAISPPDEHELYKDNFASGNGNIGTNKLLMGLSGRGSSAMVSFSITLRMQPVEHKCRSRYPESVFKPFLVGSGPYFSKPSNIALEAVARPTQNRCSIVVR